jgi:hypothetical protein
MSENERLLTRFPTPEELAEIHQHWEAVGPAEVAAALASDLHNPLIDRYPLDTCQHAREWLDDHLRRKAVRERRAARLKLAKAVLGGIGAIGTPLCQ